MRAHIWDEALSIKELRAHNLRMDINSYPELMISTNNCCAS